VEKSGELSGPASIHRVLLGPAGICGYLWGSVGIWWDLQGSVWLDTLRHPAIWLWGPVSSPVLQPLALGKLLSRTVRTTIHSPSWSYPQDGRTPPLRTLGVTPLGGRIMPSVPFSGKGKKGKNVKGTSTSDV